MTLTVRQCYAETQLRLAKLHNPHVSLDQPVRRVQTMEILDDFPNYLLPGDLLLTTAYNLRNRPDLAASLPAQLRQCGVTALVIKGGYYLETTPLNLIHAASTCGLPVFELPREVPFVDITTSIYGHLMKDHYKHLLDMQQLHHKLTQVVLEGYALDELITYLVELLGRPIVLETVDGTVLASGGLPADAPPTALTLAAVRQRQRQGLGSLAAAAAETTIEYVEHRPVYGVKARWVTPVAVESQVEAYLSVLDIGGPELISTALEHAATVVALSLFTERKVAAERARLSADLVRDLLDGTEHNEQFLLLRGRRLGIDLSPPRLLLVLEADSGSLAHLEAVRDWAQRLLPDQTLIAPVSEHVVVLAPAVNRREMREFLTELETSLDQAGIIGFRCGVSNTVDETRRYEAGYREAVAALQLGRRLFGGSAVYWYSDLELYDVFLRHLGSETIHRLGTRLVGDVAPELVATVDAFFQCDESLVRTAKMLQVHRNTVVYRLRRFEELTEVNMSRAEDRFRVRLGLMFHRLIDAFEDGTA